MLLPEELDHANTSQQDSARLKADQQPSAEIKGNTGRKPATGSAHYKGDLPKLDKVGNFEESASACSSMA